MMRKREFSFYFIASSKIFFGLAGTQKKQSTALPLSYWAIENVGEIKLFFLRDVKPFLRNFFGEDFCGGCDAFPAGNVSVAF